MERVGRPKERGKMKIDILQIQTELQELAGREKVKVKLDKRLDLASHTRQTDRGFLVRLNPTRFRSPEKLEWHLNLCREAVGS